MREALYFVERIFAVATITLLLVAAGVAIYGAIGWVAGWVG